MMAVSGLQHPKSYRREENNPEKETRHHVEIFHFARVFVRYLLARVDLVIAGFLGSKLEVLRCQWT